MVWAPRAHSGEVSFDGPLPRLIAAVAERAYAERGALVLERQGERVLAAELGSQSDERSPRRPEPLAEGANLPTSIIDHVFRTRKCLLLSELARDGAFSNDPYIVSTKPKAVLCTPLLHQGAVTGALYLENCVTRNAFTEEHAEMLGLLCVQMALSIGNASQIANLQREVKERTLELKEANFRVAKLEGEVTETHMAGSFAHEMRNALASARLVLAKVYRRSDQEVWSVCRDNREGLRELILQLDRELSESAQEDVAPLLKSLADSGDVLDQALGALDRAITRGLAITGLALDYAQTGKTKRGSDIVAVLSLVQRVLDDFNEDFKEKSIAVTVSVPEAAIFNGNEVHYHSILKNLVINARDALSEVSTPKPKEIRIELSDGPDRQVLTVSDTGVGMTAGIREKIFQPFFTTKMKNGTGLGLGVVRKLTTLYGGAVEVESEPGQGSTFRITFPKPASSVGHSEPIS